MHRCIVTFAACMLFTSAIGIGKDNNQLYVISLIELISTPEKFDGKMVRVDGFLRIHHGKPGITVSMLYLHKEDADYFLSNSVLVDVNDFILRSKEKLDSRYVSMTGKVAITPAGDSQNIVTIRDVKYCTPMDNAYQKINP